MNENKNGSEKEEDKILVWGTGVPPVCCKTGWQPVLR
jgi:hypothetical protein